MCVSCVCSRQITLVYEIPIENNVAFEEICLELFVNLTKIANDNSTIADNKLTSQEIRKLPEISRSLGCDEEN